MLLLSTAVVCLSVVVALCLQRVWEYVRCAWMLRDFPGPAPVSLVSGHVALLNSPKSSPHRTAEALSRQFGGIFRMRLYWRQVVAQLAPSLRMCNGTVSS